MQAHDSKATQAEDPDMQAGQTQPGTKTPETEAEVATAELSRRTDNAERKSAREAFESLNRNRVFGGLPPLKRQAGDLTEIMRQPVPDSDADAVYGDDECMMIVDDCDVKSYHLHAIYFIISVLSTISTSADCFLALKALKFLALK